MSRAAIIAVVVGLAACGTPAKPQVTPPSTPPVTNTATVVKNCDGESCLAVAERFAHGAGVPRDYVAAANALRRGCDAGEGLACRRLALAYSEELGGVVSLAIDEALRKGCALRDPGACLVTMDTNAVDRATIERACTEGDLEVCELQLRFEVLAKTDCGTSCQAEQSEAMHALCARGSVQACSMVAYRDCDDLGIEEGGCELEGAAKVTITRACDAGDALACRALPGREIPAGELCRAGAYGSCVEAAKAGDAEAGELGCAAGHLKACDAAGAARRDGEPPDPTKAKELFRRACELDNRRDCPNADDPELATGCGGFLVERHAPVRVKLRYRGGPAIVARTIWDDEVEPIKALARALGAVPLFTHQATGRLADAGIRHVKLHAKDVELLDDEPVWALAVIDAQGRLLATFAHPPSSDRARRFARCVENVLATPSK